MAAFWPTLAARELGAASFRVQEEEPEPDDPDVDEPLDELDVPVLVEDDVDVLSALDEVPGDAAGLAPSPAGFLA